MSSILGICWREREDNNFLGKALDFVVLCFKLMTGIVYIIVELVTNWWLLAICRVEIGMYVCIGLDRKCVGRWSSRLLVGGK